MLDVGGQTTFLTANTSPDHHQAPTNVPISKKTQNEVQQLPTGFPADTHIRRLGISDHFQDFGGPISA
jgi:hypothetical protein